MIDLVFEFFSRWAVTALALRWAAGLSGIAVVLSVVTQGRALTQEGFSLPRLISFYLIGAVLIGVPTDLCYRRFGKGPLAAGIIGFLAMVPVGFFFNWFVAPVKASGGRLVLAVLFLAFCYGFVGGIIMWYNSYEQILSGLLRKKEEEERGG